MAFSLNRIELIGNLGKDAETRQPNDNLSVTEFSLATTYSFKGKDGEYQNETTWHNCVAYNVSDFFKGALKKGKKFFVDGRLSKRDYNDKEGNKRTAVEVIVDRIIPLEDNERGGSNSEKSSGSKQSAPKNEGKPSTKGSNLPDVDDDLPF